MKHSRRKSASLWAIGALVFLMGFGAGVGTSASWGIPKTASELRRQLSFASGVSVTLVGRVILVGGETESLADHQRVEELVSAVQDESGDGTQIRSVVRLSEQAKTVVADLIERQIGSPEITVRARGETIVLEGTAESDFEADRAVEFTLTSIRSRSAATPTKASRPEKDSGRATASDVQTKQALWPSKIVDLMRIRPNATKKTSF